MKLVLAVLAALPLAAETWTLDRLFARPYLWGTQPEKITWSKQGHTLAFLWNAEGRRFNDLYAYHPESRKLVRLTRLEAEEAGLNRTAEEKDERRQQYLMPPAGLAAFDLSRDGSRAAFAFRGDLYLAATDGSTPPLRVTRTAVSESDPQLSPDSTRLAYARAGQIYIQDLKTGQTWQPVEIEGGALVDYSWSPEGERLAYRVRDGASRRMPLPNYSGRLVTAETFARTLPGDEPAGSRTFVVSARGAAPKAIDPGPWGAKVSSDKPEWAPDGSALLQTAVHPSFKRAQILVLDPAAGKSRVVVEETDAAWTAAQFAAWSPDSKSILFTSERDGWSHLYRVGAAGGAAKQITRGAWETRAERPFPLGPHWSGGHIYYPSTESATSERHFYRVDPEGGGKKALSSGPGIHVGAASADERFIALLSSTLVTPFDLFVNGDRVTRSPRPEFASYAWPATRFVSFPSRGDGKTVAAKILLPPGYDPDRRGGKAWPAVFFIHGAGYATSVLKQWGSYNEIRYAYNCFLANRGYVVFDLDYRGSSGYGRDWRTGVYLHMGGPDLDDVLGQIDYARSLGNIDMQRIGIWGVSYGGFMTNMAMFLSPDTFRAGAAWAAVNDWENYNGSYTPQRLTTPRENPEAYRRSSPITFSGFLKNPLLIVHGMGDTNVLFQDSVQLAEKLIHEGKDFSQAYYPQEDHGFIRDETWIDAFRRTTQWFDGHLK